MVTHTGAIHPEAHEQKSYDGTIFYHNDWRLPHSTLHFRARSQAVASNKDFEAIFCFVIPRRESNGVPGEEARGFFYFALSINHGTVTGSNWVALERVFVRLISNTPRFTGLRFKIWWEHRNGRILLRMSQLHLSALDIFPMFAV